MTSPSHLVIDSDTQRRINAPPVVMSHRTTMQARFSSSESFLYHFLYLLLTRAFTQSLCISRVADANPEATRRPARSWG